jgi:hypothetical protein
MITMNPVCNLSGTSGAELVQQRLDARDACQKLIAALGQMCPNGRDYIGNSDQYDADRETHFARIAAVSTLKAALTAEGLDIQKRFAR